MTNDQHIHRRAAGNGVPPTLGAVPQVWTSRDWIYALLLIAALLLAYHPAWHGKPIWDDNAHLTRPELFSWAGLGRIWVELGATQQYYPVAHSAFWLQHRLWGDNFLGYHLVNIFLHALCALLLVPILRRLEIRGAWLAAALWALHPIQVESVAWMSELKNTLSAVFYLSAALLYLRFDRKRSLKVYFAAFGLFILGLLTKSVIATLPAALLLVFYWKYGKLLWRKDVRPLIPFFATGIASGLFTSWVERTLIGADGGDFHFSLLERALIAGRAFWFYLGKLVWPANLIFIYPRWTVSALVWWQLLPPLLALGLVALLVWKRKQWGRAPLVAVLYFAGTLFPALGFLNIYPFRYSFVADHFQYLACIGPVVFLVAGTAGVINSKLGKVCGFQISGFRFQVFLPVFCSALLGGLGLLTWKQCGMYADVETLWKMTIARNPECWMAHNNLGLTLFQHGRTKEAIAHYLESVRINPANVEPRNNLGIVLFQEGQTEAAIAQFHEALKINPDFVKAHYNLGNALLKKGQPEEAIAQFIKVLRITPTNAEALNNLGNALLKKGQPEEAITQYRKALRINPAYADAHNNLGLALLQQGQASEAISQYREALRINPAYAEAHNNLGDALVQCGKTDEGITHFRKALELKPSYPEAAFNLGMAFAQKGEIFEAMDLYRQVIEAVPDSIPARNNLAWLLATYPDASVRDGSMAVQLALEAQKLTDGADANTLDTLAAAYAEAGQFPEALEAANRALQLVIKQGNKDLANDIRARLQLYQKGAPFRETRK